MIHKQIWFAILTSEQTVLLDLVMLQIKPLLVYSTEPLKFISISTIFNFVVVNPPSSLKPSSSLVSLKTK